jgi:hypothetical protein
MSAYQIALPLVPVHVAFAPASDQLVALFNDGAYKIYELHTRISRAGTRGGGAIAKPEQTQEGCLKLDNAEWRQVMLTAAGEVCALARNSEGQDVLCKSSAGSVPTNGRSGKLTHDVQGRPLGVLSTGEVVEFDGEIQGIPRFRILDLPIL